MIISDLKERWLRHAIGGNLKEMKEIYQQLKEKGWLQEVKNFKDSPEDNALMRARIFGHLDICQFLVRDDLVDVNAKNNGGLNALHCAAMNNRPEIARLVLEETSIDVNEQCITFEGKELTALHIPADWNRLEVTRILLKYKPRLLKNHRGLPHWIWQKKGSMKK